MGHVGKDKLMMDEHGIHLRFVVYLIRQYLEGAVCKREIDGSHLVGEEMEFGHQAEAVEAKAVEEQALVDFLDPQHCKGGLLLDLVPALDIRAEDRHDSLDLHDHSEYGSLGCVIER